MTSTIIEARNLVKTYQTTERPFHALNGLTLMVNQGEFAAVMGPSGCGKSTLLHMLGGLDSPDSGEVLINNARIDNLNETHRALLRRKEIGFVFQFFNLISNLSVADNIEIPALIAGTSSTEARQRREQLLNELGIPDKANAVPGQLSGGERQRVAIARSLVNNPAVLLADEPTGNLDSKSAVEVLNLLRGYSERGQTILMVTHDARVASVADRVIHMKDGEIHHETHTDHSSTGTDTLAELIQLEV